MNRGDLFAKIGRDIVFFWILSGALLSFHVSAKRAHYDRLVASGSFNAISIARALSNAPERSEISEDDLFDWYQAAGLGDTLGLEFPMPDGLDLGPYGISYIVDIQPFGTFDSCSILLRLEKTMPNEVHSFTVHPPFFCLESPVHNVFPTRLNFRTDNDGSSYLDYVFYSYFGAKAFKGKMTYIRQLGFYLSHCDIQDFCLEGEFKPIDFQLTPQIYIYDSRVGKEFRLKADRILPKEAFDKLAFEMHARRNDVDTISADEYSNIIRRAQSDLKRFDSRDKEAFFQQPIPAVIIPFIGILISAFLASTVLSRSRRLGGPLIGDAEGHILGACPAWNLPQLAIKALMALTPIGGVAVAGLVFQDIFRLQLGSGIFINPLDGMILELTPRVEAGRSIVNHDFPLAVFPLVLGVWLLSISSAILSTFLIAKHIFLEMKVVNKIKF